MKRPLLLAFSASLLFAGHAVAQPGPSPGATPPCNSFGTTTGTCIQGAGAGGTPSSITLTNGTGLPISTGVGGLGTGVATILGATPTGTGSLVAATSPTLVTPVLGTPSSGDASNLTNIPVNQATGVLPAGAVPYGSYGMVEALNVPVSGTGDVGTLTVPNAFYLPGNIFLYNCSAGAGGSITATLRTAASGGGAVIATSPGTTPAAGSVTNGSLASGLSVYNTTTLYFNITVTTATGTCSVLFRYIPIQSS